MNIRNARVGVPKPHDSHVGLTPLSAAELGSIVSWLADQYRGAAG